MTAPSVVLRSIETLAADVPWSDIDRLEQRMRAARRIYAYAVGRCGLVLRMFVMRLVHLGFACHVVGEVTTPAIGPDDLLLIASGSGRTPTVAAVVEQARSTGADVLLLSTHADSPLAARCTTLVQLPGRSKLDVEGDEQPPGSTFEQMLFCFLEEAVVVFMRHQGVSATEVMARHANVE